MSIVHTLALETGLRDDVVEKIMRTAPVRYKEYQIPKRSGGMRDIAQPAPEVKLLQRALMNVLLAKLPVHEAAAAYRAGRSIRHNAERHSANGPLLKMDFASFFPSIRSSDWVNYCADKGLLEGESDVHLTSLLLFKRNRGSSVLRLAIGAPSSPMLSNLLLFEFDELLTQIVSGDKATYTRYADDLTFSAPRTGYLTGVQKAVRQAIRTIRYPTLEINESKTNYATRRYSRRVTGLVLANDGRVTIGKAEKRRLNAAVYNARKGLLNDAQMRSLCGHLAHVNSVEPTFLQVLERRYGQAIITAIQKSVVIPEKTISV